MKKYNKSEIMKRAHWMHRRPFAPSFSYCLKKAWAEAKQAVINRESIERMKREQPRTASQVRNYNAYRGCSFGKNDWSRDYQNDAKVAVRRAMQINRLNSNL